MRIAVTGGLGFIGTTLARRLVAAGHDVLLIDNLSPQIHGAIPAPAMVEGASVERLDIREAWAFPEKLEGLDIVYHLAAETGTAQSMYQVRGYVDVNEMGTAALVEALAKVEKRPHRIILASSRSVYGEGAYVDPAAPDRIVQPQPRTPEQLAAHSWELQGADGKELAPIPTPETLPFAPGSVYAATKASQELLLRAAAPALGIKPVIFRFQNVYGEGQSLRNPYTGIISIFFNRARQGFSIPIYEDGLESRDFVHVDDVVDAMVAAMTAELPDGATMNLGAGSPTRVKDLVGSLLRAAKLDVPVEVTAQYRVGDIRHCFADLTEAQRLIGFRPKVGLDEGLRRFCDWAWSQPAYEDRLDAAMAELRARKLAAD